MPSGAFAFSRIEIAGIDDIVMSCAFDAVVIQRAAGSSAPPSTESVPYSSRSSRITFCGVISTHASTSYMLGVEITGCREM